MVVGILALQGGVAEHARTLASLGASTRPVRRAADVDGLDALVFPGGESTTMLKLLDVFALREPLTRAASTLPVLGTCAGLILLSELGLLDVDVQRNAFGPQADSAEAVLPWPGGEVRAAFIRAPAVTRVGPGVETLSEFDGRVVAVRQGLVTGVSFHPEVTGDDTVHLELLAAVSGRRPSPRRSP